MAVNQGIRERIAKAAGRLWFLRPQELTEAHLRQIHAVKHFIKEKKIDVLKDLYFIWLYNCYAWKGIKYIWTKRNFDEIVKSTLRLQKRLGAIKTRTYEKKALIFEQYKYAIETLMKQIPDERIEIHLEDLLSDTLKIRSQLSNFLGREIDMSIVSSSETWQEKRVPQ